MRSHGDGLIFLTKFARKKVAIGNTKFQTQNQSRPPGFTGPMDIEIYLGKDVVQVEAGRAHCFTLQCQLGRIMGSNPSDKIRSPTPFTN